MQNLNPIKPPFYKLKKFYIPFVLFIALFVILISLTHRPLEALWWSKFEANDIEQKATLNQYSIMFSGQCLKQGKSTCPHDVQDAIDSLYKIRKEMLRSMNEHINNFEFDLKIAKILDLEQIYLLNFLSKAEIQSIAMATLFELSLTSAIKEYKSQEDIEEILAFFDKQYNYTLRINELFNDSKYTFVKAMTNGILIATYAKLVVFLLSKEERCSLENKDIIISRIFTLQEHFTQLAYNMSDEEIDESLRELYRQGFVQGDENSIIEFIKWFKEEAPKGNDKLLEAARKLFDECE